MAEHEASQEEQRQGRVDNLMKWLKRKEDERLDKAQKEVVMMQQVQAKEAEKAEMLKKLEEERVKERERRLKIAERQKAQLQEQLLQSKQAVIGAKQDSVDSLGGRQLSKRQASSQPSLHQGMSPMP